MKPIASIRIGGLALIVGALAFMGVFAFLAARFDYPAVLDGPAGTVLPKLLATGAGGRAAWALYAFLPSCSGIEVTWRWARSLGVVPGSTRAFPVTTRRRLAPIFPI